LTENRKGGNTLSTPATAPDLFQQILQAALKANASDIHLTAGCQVRLRICEDLAPHGTYILKPKDTEAIAMDILRRGGRLRSANPADAMSLLMDMDCSYSAPGIGRFRVNICFQRGTVAVVMRRIPHDIPTCDQLHLPQVIKEIAMEPRGLVLVTGMTGCGKSTTLASMIDLINTNCPYKIVTIEDPIEFLYRDKKSSITQREVGGDTSNFARALRAALRQDPDVILVGEMRDEETVDIALKAAETGQLVLSTLHTTDAAKTLNRLVSFATPAEQGFLRIRVADSLRAIISQRLLPTPDEKGRIPAVEVLRTTASIQDCITNPEKTATIPDFIRNGRDQYGMQTFDQHLLELLEAKLITLEAAKSSATSASDFQRGLVYM
jgi:twitching motility protein PilT